MILVDGALGIPTLHKLNQFLSSSPFFSLIPLMIESASISPSIINDLRKLSFVDDIIEIRQSDAKLHHKIRFVKKIKDFNNQKELQRKIQRPANYMTPKGGFFKRSFDILVSSMALIALSPIFLVIGIAIRMESKGPIFYIAKRAGRGYRIFSFFKFRTMQIDADKKVAEMSHLNQYDAATGPVFFKVSNDPRITKVGAFLRNTSLDEFPQLFNVLIGDMSLVGNRPLPLYEAQTLTTDEWAARFMAPAGMTGLWQIKKRGQKDMSVEERISLDITYAHRNNFMYDLWIMANTPTALMQKTNA
ncbi:MAG: sugar transferase [Gemmatimonadaceae bacterium]|nr:sugar transferase [Chitinophagaceae bacterium]